MKKIKTRFVCSNCGYISFRYLGKCPNCGQWNSLIEEKASPNNNIYERGAQNGEHKTFPQSIATISEEKLPRTKTNISELNRVLGGGIVTGSLILIGGDPGIGKSTLMLQISNQLAKKKNKVLYVSGEESSSQIKLRADRLGSKAKDLLIYTETDISNIKFVINKINPKYLVIDSIQTMQKAELESPIGSVAQVREITADLMQLAKNNGITIFIVGQITKGGFIAGPKTLEHMVDTVLYFEGNSNNKYRVLRTIKNRFGSTNELGVFEMFATGLKEVSNPSKIFLGERLKGATGSAVTASIEGSRPILVEVQALVAPSIFGNPQRVVAGVDRNRVSQILAVLEKHSGLKLQNQDVHVRVTGGIKITGPAADLSIAMAVASSYYGKPTKTTDVFLGEVGLGGEIRSIALIEDLLKEINKLGFKRAFVSKNNLTNNIGILKNLNIIGSSTIEGVLNKAFY